MRPSTARVWEYGSSGTGRIIIMVYLSVISVYMENNDTVKS